MTKMINFGQDVTVADLRKFIRGGHAIFTLESQKTQVHYTYRITKKEAETWVNGKYVQNPQGYIYFISFLHSGDSYEYMGVLDPDDLTIRLTKKSKITNDALVYKAITYFLTALKAGVFAQNLTIYHANKCSVCGRELTEPESVRLGIGPVCRESA